MTMKHEKNFIEKMALRDKVFLGAKFARHCTAAVIAVVVVWVVPFVATLFGMSKNVVSLFESFTVLIGFLGLFYLFACAVVNFLKLIIKLWHREKSDNQE